MRNKLLVAITEDDLRVIVTGIGPIEEINLHRDDDGESKGFCFVQFKKVSESGRGERVCANDLHERAPTT